MPSAASDLVNFAPLPGAAQVTGAQLRAARAMTRLTFQALAEAAGLSVSTLRRAEDVDGALPIKADSIVRLVGALQDLGVTFTPAADGGYGSVSWRPASASR